MQTSAIVRIAAAGALAWAVWRVTQQKAQQAAEEPEAEAWNFSWAPTFATDFASEAGENIEQAAESAAEFVDKITGGFLKVSAMSRVNPLDLSNRNVQAMLAVIRRGEGTAGPNGYRMIFGGQLFDSFADHPRITVKKSGYTSTAAGAYQFIVSSWDETARIMRLPDFSPRSQDLAALGRIVARGALDDVKRGDLETALRKLGREWASLPGSPYGQPTISMGTASDTFAAAGGEPFYA